MNNKALSILVSPVIISSLFVAQGIARADGVSVQIGSDDLSVSVGGINVDVDGGADSSVQVNTEESNITVTDDATGQSFVNADFNGNDFSNQDFTGADFSNADLTNVSFRGANLSGTNFLNATFHGCDLRGAIVDGASFLNADFGNTKTSGVDFSRADMTNVDISNVDTKESASLSSKNITVILGNKSGKAPPRVNLDIRFAHDSDRVEAISMKQINDLSKALQSEGLKNKGVIIEGHTDSDGTNAYNLDLSQRRSQSVIKILMETHGISLSRLTSKGYGEEKPVYSNKTSFGKSINRRVAVVLAN